MTIGNNITNDYLIFYIYPNPKGCKDNQFAPFRVWGKQIDFRRQISLLLNISDTHIEFNDN